LKIKKKINDKSKLEIVKNAAIYEYNLTKGRREIIHLDAFIISLLTIK